MQRRKQLEKYTQLVKYVTEPEEVGNTWRPRPTDPYIYISFSRDLLIAAYGREYKLMAKQRTDIETRGYSAFKAEIKKALFQIIQEEWLTKTKVPIKYLPANATIENIKNKNVIFIYSGYASILEDCIKDNTNLTYVTHYVSYNHPNGKTLTHAKFIILPRFDSVVAVEDFRYLFLHETMHAIVDGKHFKQYSSADPLPFNPDLTCKDSVLANPADCPGVSTTIRTCHEFSKFLRQLPASLMPLDLALAERFVESFARKNLESSSIPDTKPKVTVTKSELVSLRVEPKENSFLDTICEIFKNYATSVVAASPTYFPARDSLAHLNYWTNQNPLTLFGNKTATQNSSNLLSDRQTLQLT